MEFRLKKLLDERGVTQYQLAKALDISHGAVTAWVRGRIRKGVHQPVYPEYETLERICGFLDVGVADILVFQPAQPGETFRDFPLLVAA